MGIAEGHPRNWLARFTAFWWSDKGLSALLVMILLAFMLAPLVRSGLSSGIISIFFSLLLLSGIHTITEKKLHRAGVAVVVLIGIILTWMKNLYPASRSLYAWSDLFSLIFLILLTQVVIRHVYQEGPVTLDRIRGAIAAYILVGFTWAILYHFIELSVPGSFRLTETAAGGHYFEQQSDLTYYSFMTMTTVGYGDIIPVNPMARTFAVLEALIGQLYPATLLARLVSLQISHPGAGKEKEK
jgi:hypothetical protein